MTPDPLFPSEEDDEDTPFEAAEGGGEKEKGVGEEGGVIGKDRKGEGRREKGAPKRPGRTMESTVT